ncbi:MAG TPA: SLBB domain-containing protein [Fimbriimonadaceae bacterium]|nr:SLBB domain-containing protein [Fimbriimonadaceae bacterium]
MSLVFGQEPTLRPNDRLYVFSSGDTPIASLISLSPQGVLRLPNGKGFVAAGLTPSETVREIRRILGPNCGQVGIELRAPVKGQASFRGAVKQNGTIEIGKGKTIADVLGIAEPTDSGDLSSILILTATGETIRIDAEKDDSFTLRSGDQILIPQVTGPNEVLVLGGVKNPGSIAYQRGMTLQTAVELAGGLTGHAINDEIQVLRADEPVPGALWTDAGKLTQLRRGDVVRVGNTQNGRYISVLGYVKNPGLVAFKDGMTLLEAIEAAGGTNVGAGKDAVEIRKVFGGRGKTRKFDINSLQKGSAKDPKLAPADVVFVPAFVFKSSKGNSTFRPVVPPRRSR